MTTNKNNDCNIGESLTNSELYTTYADISSLFKNIKSKGILNDTIKIDTYVRPNDSLLGTGDFMDKVIYYRMKKNYTPSVLSSMIGLDRDSYYQYENKILKLNNIDTIIKIINALEMNEEDLPEYVRFIIDNPLEKIKSFMEINNMSKKEFSEKTKIPLRTIHEWFQKEDKQISIKNYNKMKLYIGNDL